MKINKLTILILFSLLFVGCATNITDEPTNVSTPIPLSCPVCPTESPPTPTPYWEAVPTDPVPYHFREGIPVFEDLVTPARYPYFHVICSGWWWRQYGRTPLFRGPYWTDSLYLNDVVASGWIRVVGIHYNSPDEIFLMVNGSAAWDIWVPFKHANCPDGQCGNLFYSDLTPTPVTSGG